MQKLSDASLRALQPPERGQKLIYDAALPSFGVRLSQGGTRSFFLQYGSDRRFITIGRFPVISLSDARTEAKRLLAEFTLGKVRPQSITYQSALDLFLEEKTKGRRARTVYDYKRLLERFNFKGQLTELTHEELQRRLKRFTAQGEYNHLLVALKVFCNWAIKRRYIEHNPTLGLSTHATVARSRVLTDAELKLIWQACEQTGENEQATDASARVDQGSPFPDVRPRLPANYSTIVKLLICTGQRKGEIAALQTSWLHSQTLTIPASATKNGREHILPLAERTQSILHSVLTPLTGQSDGLSHMLFPARGSTTKCFNGWSKSKAALDKLSGVSDWTLHDLRRTVATNMAQQGTPPHVIERILNHISGQISGVAATYNRATYLTEMREALRLWEAKLQTIVAEQRMS